MSSMPRFSMAVSLLLTGFSALLFIELAEAASVGEGSPDLWVDGPADVKLGNDPQYPDAARDHRGRSIFVWYENSLGDVLLRILDVDGTSLKGPVKINTYDDNKQDYPHVAVSADGSFVVVWQSAEEPEPGDGFYRKIIRSQAFDSDGNPTESEQILSTLQTLASGDATADVAALNGGGYAVVWSSANTAGGDSNVSIQGRVLNSAGNPAGPQFQVNSSNGAGSEQDCSVAGLSDGGFVATWSVPQVHGRRFSANGSPVGDDFLINTSDSRTESNTDVAVHSDGRVLVVWTDPEDATNGSEIRGRMYSSDLAAQGSEFRINTTLTGNQVWPKIAPYDKGGFFVVWESVSSSGSDTDPASIEGRLVTGSNAFGSVQFLINNWTTNSQSKPGAGGMNGRVAVAWQAQDNAETVTNVITGQTWNICGIFCDGFEGAD